MEGVQGELWCYMVGGVGGARAKGNPHYDYHTGPLVDVKKWLDDQEWEAELNLRTKCR